MSLVRSVQLCALVAVVMSGCRTAPLPKDNVSTVSPAIINPAGESTQRNIRTTAFEEPLPPANDSVRSDDNSQAELALPELIIQVQNRNPSLQAMAASWQAAAQRYPQVVSLDDPTFSAMAARAVNMR